jgi:glycosyltransferase involved in cell wall biosynthesis
VNSVLQQSYSNWEQIIIDDGSTDDTGKIVCRYKDSRIHYQHQANTGPFELANSYNRALSLARGELVAILEGDDFWPSEMLAKMVPAFLDQGVVLAYGEAADVDADGNEQRRKSRAIRSRKNLSPQVLFNSPVGSATYHMLAAEGRSLISPSTVILRRSVLDHIGGFQRVPGLPLTDYPTFIELSLSGRFYYSPQTMGYRRRHGASITMNHARAIYERVSHFTLGFVASHSNQISLSDSEMKKIQATWLESEDNLHFSEGRSLLLKKMWSEARPHFRAACRSRSLAMQLTACAGLILSWLHSDLEGLMRIGGRAGLRRSIGQSSTALDNNEASN